jgi:adenylate kinase family enzyme
MILTVLGLPGAGKSTLAQALEKKLSAFYAHPGRYAVAAGLVDNQHPGREELAAIPGLTEDFLAHLSEHVRGSSIVMDGFPRTREQAKKLVETGWNVHAIHLVFSPGQERELSIDRQQKRVDEEGVADIVEHSVLVSQTDFAIEHDLAAIEELRSSGVTIIDIDATQSIDGVLRQALLSLNAEPANRSDENGT